MDAVDVVECLSYAEALRDSVFAICMCVGLCVVVWCMSHT